MKRDLSIFIYVTEPWLWKTKINNFTKQVLNTDNANKIVSNLKALLIITATRPIPFRKITDQIHRCTFQTFKLRIIRLRHKKISPTSISFIVKPLGRNNFNKVQTYLNEIDADFHAFKPRNHRSYNTIIRNLHFSTTDTEMALVLSKLGHSVKWEYNFSD